mgnify:FL=1
MGRVRRSLLVALVLLGWALPVTFPPGAAAQPRSTEPVGVYIDRGILEYDDKKYAEALKNFLEALQIDPENAEVRYFVGIAYLALDQADQAITHLEKARQLDPADLDIAFNLGVAHFTKEEYDRAQPHFLFVHGKEPRRDNLGYYLGFIHFQRKEYEKALAYFQENVSSDVRFQQQNRFYTGLTKHHLGRDEEATRDLEEAVKLRPDAPLGRTAKLFAEAVAPRPVPRRYRVELRGGVSYDDNATLAPTRPVLGLRTQPRRSAAEIALLRLEYDLIQTQPDTLTASYQIFSNYYNSLQNLDVLNHTWGADYVHRGRLGTLPAWYGAQYSYDYVELDGAVFLSRHMGTASLTLFENDSNFTQFQYRFQDKDFRSANTLDLRKESRDGQNHLLGATHILFLGAPLGPVLPGRKPFLTLDFLRFGFQFDVDDTVGADYRYFGEKASAGFQVTGPWDVRFQAGYDFQFRDYPNKNALAAELNKQAREGSSVQGAPFNVMRRDSDHTFTASLSRDFPYGFTASLEFFKEWNSSTFSLFDFDRNVVTLSVGWKY